MVDTQPMTMDLSGDALATALAKTRAAWWAMHPDAGDDDVPQGLRAASERRAKEMAKCQWCANETAVGKPCRYCGLTAAQAKQAAEGLQRQANRTGESWEGRAAVGTKSTTRIATPAAMTSPASLTQLLADAASAQAALERRLASAERTLGLDKLDRKEPAMTVPKNQREILSDHAKLAKSLGLSGADDTALASELYRVQPERYGEYRTAPATPYVVEASTGRLIPASEVKETPAPKPLSLAEAEATFQREPKPVTAKAVVDAAIREIQARNPQRSYADALSDVYGRHPELYEAVRRGSYSEIR
jgi:hypothetical protein